MLGSEFIGKLFKIGELAELAGVSKRTIDYYTQLGLLEPVRSETNYRYYPEESIERLRLIDALKKQHLTLEEIKERLQIIQNQPDAADEIVDKIEHLQEEMKHIQEELLELKPLLKQLNEQQIKLMTKPLAQQGYTLLHTLAILLGGDPFIN
ncbi:MerR family transcriptional regulator [Geobacillus sp. NFOSA3]|nr:MerR family transcriptional regulator [Geobacillus sp. NFOSA3]PDM40762.1 MerR family transcriptional regulator [Parageobacillus yumthangensis]PUF89335.1 MerR family DNA-binding transcriptional regulator [Geobacillus sp. LYN3]QIQ34413.1 MerR family transcriptional regulator [Parageobacillus toebii NBRC 107807]RDV21618.1 MerR family transcriptional regulator [Parageobacillus toebii]TXK86438.1 MerR family transcriptional regulator [Geobacillus sp. AYS3]TXK90982.1 MerR family transcriptional r